MVDKVKLTPQREIFAREYFRLGNASRAYRAAFNVGPKTQPKTIWEAASRLAADSKVAARIEQLRAAAVEKAAKSVADIVVDLDQARSLALDLDNPSAAVSASHVQARVLGLLKDKVELTGKDGAAIQVDAEVSQAEQSAFALGRRLAYMLAQGRRRLAPAE